MQTSRLDYIVILDLGHVTHFFQGQVFNKESQQCFVNNERFQQS